MPPRPILVVGDSRAVLSGFTPEPVSLAALVASGVPIEWHEGVAIVQETCRHLLETSTPQSAGALSAADVRIDLTGAVFVTGGGVQDGPAAVSQLGAMLRDLLGDNTPVQLRLAISQAMSNPPYYPSIKSFSDALAYFERPDRRNIIRILYERWDVQARSRSAPASHDAPASEPEREVVASPSPQPPAAGPQRWMVVGGIIGLVLTLALVLVAVWLQDSNKPAVDNQTEPSAPVADRSAQTVGAESPSLQTAPPDSAPPKSVAPPAANVADTPDTKPTPPIHSARPDAQRPHPETPDAPVALAAAPTPAARLPVAPSPQSASQPSTVTDQTQWAAVTVLEPAPGSHIYSALDADVAAPVAQYPQSSTVATVMHDDEALVFDVVIDQTGKVESVKLMRAPRSIRSTLLLTMSMSVAKAWRFQPATRHGQSVKYRQSISVPAPR